MTRRLIVQRLYEHFKDDLVIFKSKGLVDIVSLRSVTSKSMRLAQDTDDDIDETINKLSKLIKDEVKQFNIDKDVYETRINRQKCEETVSGTLLKFLGTLSTDLDRELPALLIGSIVTAFKKKQPTSLQVALGVKMRSSKKQINFLQKFGVTCSYDEVLLFKHSAAKVTTLESRSNSKFKFGSGCSG